MRQTEGFQSKRAKAYRARRAFWGVCGLIGLAMLVLIGCGATATAPTAVSTILTDPEASRFLTLGDIDPEDPAKKLKRFKPLADYLARHLEEFGISRGQVVIARDIDEMAQFLNDGTVDVLFDSAFPTLAVQELSGSQPILRRWKESDPEYWGVYVATRVSGISSVEDLVSKVIAFEEPHSTSGFVLPAGTLVRRGFRLKEVDGPDAQVGPGEIGYFFTFDEQDTIALMMRGLVAAGGISNQDYEELPPEIKEQIVVFDRTITVPRQLVSVRSELALGVVEKIRELLIGLEQTDEGRQILDGLKKSKKFDPVPAESYDALGELKSLMTLVANGDQSPMRVPAWPRLRWGITAFLAVSIVVIVLLALAISTLLDIRRERAAFRETLNQRAALMASTLSDVMADSTYHLDIDDLGDLAKVVGGEQDIEYVVVFDPEGRILVDSEQESRYPVGEIEDEGALSAVAAGQRVTRPGDRTLEVFAPIQIGSDVIGGVRFGYDTSPLEAEVRALTVQRIWQSSGVVAAAIVLSYMMAWYLVRPIRRLVHATQQVASGNLDFDEPVHRRDEIGDLTSAFASMTRGLRASREALESSHRELESKVEERTHQLLAASRAKSEFVANMSHEIRTPINGVMGMTELLLGTEVTDEQREYLELTRKSSDALLEVINDVLDFSKIEAGKLDMEPTDFDLHDTLADAMELLALRAHEKGLELAYDLRSDVPTMLSGDPGRLRQVLINLVGNAIKFTERGEVVVRVEPRSKEADEGCLHFSVADTGIGIPAKKQSAIFDAFSQVDGSTTRRYGGTGLGLAVSSQLVEMMGGRIWVESEIGQGSVFHFTARFGLQADTPVESAAEVKELYDLPVLVVDDHATNRRILKQMLSRWRMRPTTVDGGQAALLEIERALAAGDRFPLVLTASSTSGMDGFALIEQVKRMPGYSAAG